MKIKLFYIHPTNYGNLMMACSFIENINRLLLKKDIIPEFYMDVLDNDELNRVKKSVSKNIILKREDLFDRKRRGLRGKIEKLINIPREISYNSKNYDLCIVLGGDCISQYYSKQIFISDMYKFKKISKNIPFYLIGQTMGPFHGYAINLVKKCLKNCKIFVRDHDCYNYLKNEFNFKELYESRDLAFLDIPFQNEKEIMRNTLTKFNLENIDYVTIVASGAISQYTDNLDDYISEYIKIIVEIIENQKMDVLLLAHVIHVSTSNDKVVINQIMKLIPEEYKNNIHVIDYLIYPYEARILLGNGKYTITGRMHAAVSSINMGVIPICLSYSVKFKGVIGDDFKLNKYIIQCRGNEYWRNDYTSKYVKTISMDLLNNKDSLLNEINKNIIDIQNKAMLQINAIIDELNTGEKDE